MVVLEALTLSVGSSVAKSVLRLWLKDQELARDTSLGLADLLNQGIAGYAERRRAARQFDGLADEVAEKLLPLMEHEYRGIPEHEVLAAISAVGDAVSSSSVSIELLAINDLDPARLESHVRASSSAVIENASLSEAAEQVFNRVLTEACNYTIEIAGTLPVFGSAAAVETLRRETEILDLVRTVLARLPEPASRDDQPDAKALFETQYLRDLARKLDHLDLFGVDATPLSKRYALTVAYITLSSDFTTSKASSEMFGGTIERAEGAESIGDAGAEYVRVNDALAHSSHMFIRGQAGSGKTTLLRWLAVRAARRGFTDALSSWNGAVPFVIELRRYVGGQLPAPEGFIRAIAPNLAEEMPTGWVHHVLRQGRGLLLIDGVDEIPEGDRPDAKEWIADLVRSFPDNRVVVTSRPAAVNEDWLEIAGFEHCDLQPMTPDDINELIDKWHEAVGSAIGDVEEANELRYMAIALKNRVRDTPSLRSLATSPLLCAMLCALNRDRRQQIPKDRMEIYRIALEMLLDRRDVERKIPTTIDDADGLPDREKRLLLQHFAYWMILNSYSDSSLADAEICLEHRLETMQRVTANGPAVLRYLLERSGLVREAVVGRVDFIHRTFQEYLAAKEAIDSSHVGLLVQHAHLDQWREVIVLAAGHSTKRVANELLSGLMDRGDAEPAERHRLHLLAVACLSTVVETSLEVAARLEGCLEELLPPTNMTDAAAVASAGEIAIPLIVKYQHERATVAAACVRTLTLIGGEAALEALRVFGSDDRVTVSRELMRSWDYFEPEAFASQVLADSILEYGTLSEVNSRQLSALPYLNKLRAFEALLQGEIDTAAFHRVSSLAVSLQILKSEVANLDFSDCADLAYLRIGDCPNIRDLESLRGLAKLSRVVLTRTGVEDFSAVRDLPALRALTVTECVGIRTIAPILELRGVHILLDIELRDPTVLNAEFIANNRVEWKIHSPDSMRVLSRVLHRADGSRFPSGGIVPYAPETPGTGGPFWWALSARIHEDEVGDFLAMSEADALFYSGPDGTTLFYSGEHAQGVTDKLEL